MTISYYLIAALIGLTVGISELISRYRDEPHSALWSAAAAIYIGINGGASVAALYFIEVYRWSFGVTASPDGVSLVQVLAAGFGAMALFRSAFFTVRMGNDDVPVGPSTVLHVILNSVDRAVDRKRAVPRVDAVHSIMQGVSFVRAHTALPAFCFAIMQNVSAAEQQRIGIELVGLASADASDQVKSYVLGLTLLNVVGEKVLRTAVQALNDELRGQVPEEFVMIRSNPE